ncbi:hypothetical protein JD844_022921 [Phrynosoma platyrhinos]|uniref:Uncharacterized protein n=1 Tax=Phrynosoma platyrhinos TaxID=52577 RepID=A0ABQ7SW34_PHRPL|nr:hypothetical protein JD844_022921 [Phrynosoma platyrhinos]
MILQKENQEVAYIRFLKASQAALAIEQCDKSETHYCFS